MSTSPTNPPAPTLDELRRTKVTDRTTRYIVPAGTPKVACRGCPARIYLVKQSSGRLMPIDCDVAGGAHPFGSPAREEVYVDGVGVSHFVTCPEARRFSGQSRKRNAEPS